MHPDPLSHSDKALIVQTTYDYIAKAAWQYEIELENIPVLFTLGGLKAGMYRRQRRARSINYNPHIFAHYMQDSLDNTIPHEVAHYVTDALFGLATIKPHGVEWQAVMNSLGAVPSRTCNYDLSNIPHRQEKRHSYRCDCREHQLTTRRHNKIQNQRNYYICKSCKQRLVYQDSL